MCITYVYHVADDQSRVCVRGDPAVEGSDYINASFIDVCKAYNSSYIAFHVDFFKINNITSFLNQPV